MTMFMTNEIATAHRVPTYEFVTPVLRSKIRAFSEAEAIERVNALYMGFTDREGTWKKVGDFEFSWESKA